MSTLRKTPLHETHIALGAKMTPFGGFEMPVQYEGIIKEYTACRENVAVFDTSHMGEFIFKGDLEASGINHAVTMDLIKLPVGKCKYGFILNEQGTIVDDIIVYKLADDKLMIVVNAGHEECDFNQISQCLSGDCLFENISDKIAKIDVQGPEAARVLESPYDEVLNLKFFGFTCVDDYGENFILSRTGYTGELGFEIYCDADKAENIWDFLIDEGVTPAGLGARDVLRLEKGYSLYGNDITLETTPLEANLGFFLARDKDFVGKAALDTQKETGFPKRLVPLKSATRRSPRNGFDLMQGDTKIGHVTSGVFSPKLGYSIALGYVDKELEVGTKVEAFDGRAKIEMEITTLPFLEGGSLKKL